MTTSIHRVAIAALLLLMTAATMAAGDLASQLREAMKVPADYQVIFHAEDGSALTQQQASHLMLEGGEFAPVRDDATKTLRVRVERPQPALTRLPPFDLQTLDGKRKRNADLAGKPTLMNFFFETCVPCIKEAPALDAFARKHPEFNYLAVTFDSQAVARRFVQRHKFTWPVVADAKAFIDAAGVRGYPTYMLIAVDGRVLGRGAGMRADQLDDPKAIEAHFEKWVAEKLK